MWVLLRSRGRGVRVVTDCVSSTGIYAAYSLLDVEIGGAQRIPAKERFRTWDYGSR